MASSGATIGVLCPEYRGPMIMAQSIPSSGKLLVNQVLRTIYTPTSIIVDERDHATCLPDLARPFAPAKHTPGPPLASPGSIRSWASDPEAGILGRHGHLHVRQDRVQPPTPTCE
jgi:hypothetical protein